MINMYTCTRYIGSLFLSSLVSTTALNCISMKNQECKLRPELMKQGI